MTDEAADEGKTPLSRGAEASLRRVEWMGLAAIAKERDAKGYRPKALDQRLRTERTRAEVRLLVEARRLGVRTPIVYDIDLARHRLIMEELPGSTLRACLEDPGFDPEALRAMVRSLGVALGRLHAGGIAHGDLTSSNVLFPEGPNGPAALIDLSMGTRNAGVEELGIDLHLVDEDLRALSPKGEALLKEFFAGYAEGNPTSHTEVRARAREIRARMRYV
ncbi:MAG: Kae1-associated serine/threonine protein kinase [Candidatus Thermoplasmatota archaeon]|nr:Kae1-associated serine/threonine protein kinase [Candidatus Thermoplasmatota archaeon]MCL5983259.1 Kae1-associated serine/threonine protein kinase [Candidatus Thermoplasmatota archaeon]